MNSHLENAIASLTGVEYAVPTGRGTTALWAAARGLFRPGNHILVPVNVCEVVVAALRQLDLVIRYVDVDPIEGLASVEEFEASFDSACCGLVAVHNFGTPLPMRELCAWARARQLSVIEDCCNAAGAWVDGAPVGSFGSAAIHSFRQGKNVDLGAGGLMATRDPCLASSCAEAVAELPRWSAAMDALDGAVQSCLRGLRSHEALQEESTYSPLFRKYLPALLAGPPEGFERALLRIPDELGRTTGLRRASAQAYREGLNLPGIVHRRHVEGDACWRYTFHVPAVSRDTMLQRARAAGIPASRWFPPIHNLFPDRSGSARSYPGAERFSATVLNLFVEPEVDRSVVESSIQAVAREIERHAVQPVDSV